MKRIKKDNTPHVIEGPRFLYLNGVQVQIVSEKAVDFWHYSYLAKTVQKSIKFNCDFNKCKGRCCNACSLKGGFLNWVTENRVKIYIDNWSNETGFKGPNGCKLPYELRSITCITYACDGDTSVLAYRHMHQSR